VIRLETLNFFSKASMVLRRTGSAPERACLSEERSMPEVSPMFLTQFLKPKSGETVKVPFTRVTSSSQVRGFLRSGGRSQSGEPMEGGVKAQPISPMS
jgi:hypothetical protein